MFLRNAPLNNEQSAKTGEFILRLPIGKFGGSFATMLFTLMLRRIVKSTASESNFKITFFVVEFLISALFKLVSTSVISSVFLTAC